MLDNVGILGMIVKKLIPKIVIKWNYPKCPSLSTRVTT